MQFLRIVLLAALATPFLPADWNQWRGPDRDGVSTETDLLAEWPEDGPELLFKTDGLGAGYSSFAFSGDRMFTQGQKEGKQFLLALDSESGQVLWQVEHGAAYSNNRGSGPRGTPVLDGEFVYALGGDGSLICARQQDGETVWRVDLLQRFGGDNIRWGLSESPLIDGDQLIVNAGGSGSSVVALNKASGEEIWRSQDDEAGYSSAVVAEVGGVRHYILLTGEGAIGLRAADGELLWRYAPVSNRTANIATPIVRGDRVFVSSDYGTGGALLQLKAADGGVTAEEVYFTRDMRNHYSSSVLIGDTLYGYSSRILTAMQFATGEVLWQDRSVGKGQVIFADGRLYLLGEDGVVGMAQATPEAYREISRFEIGREDFPTWTLPAIHDGRLWLRDQDALYCYRIR